MAKKLKDEDLVLNIIINGNKSKKEMNELERAITDTNREINSLKKTQKDLIAQGKKETDAYKATVVAIEQKNKAVLLAEARLTQLRKGMKLTEMSVSDLRKEQKRLTQLLNTSVPKSANYEQYKKQLQEVSGRIDELKDKAKGAGFSLQEMANKFNHYIGIITAGIVTLVGLVSGLQSIITTFAEFDDKVADVQKTTGLAKDEVLELNNELKKIRTRTAQEDLLALSRVAGKLGLSAKEDILGFVKATDQIGVALAEDLGGDVEDAINSVGKLVDIFKIKEEFGIEKALLKVGSTINELGASSTANEGYLVNFTNRMAGVAPLAGITIQQVLGLGATLDQFGQTAEVSSTALSKLFIKMAADAEKYSKYAGMSVNDFKVAIEKDFMGTFIKVLDGVKKNAGGINELADSLGDLGLDGGRVVGVLGTLANNTFVLKKQLDLANQSFADGTSLTNEFNIKNETAAAKLDMARKAIYNMSVELGEKLYPVMTISLNGFTMLVKVLSVLASFLIENRKAISLVLAALIGYNSVLLISNALTGESIILKRAEIALAKLKVFWDNAQTAALHLLGAGYMLVRGNIAAAKAEFALFNAVTAANPIGIFVAVLAAAVIGISLYTRKLTDAEKAQRTLNDIQIEANKSTAEEKNKIDAVNRVLTDEIATRAEKLKAVKTLRELMPEHLKAYSDEEILAGKATKAVGLYVDQLERKARVNASSKKLADLDAQRDEVARLKSEGLKGASIGDRLLAATGKDSGSKYISILDERLKDIDQAQGLIRKKMDKDIRADFDFSTVNGLQAYADKLQIALGKLKKGTNEYKKIKDEIVELNTSIAFQKANPVKPDADNVVTGESEKDKKATLKAERDAAAERAKNLKKETDAENLAYQEKLKAAGLFGVQKNLLTADQLEVLLGMEKEHQDKINSINEKGNKVALEKTSQAADEIKKRQDAELAYRQKLINPENELIEQENEVHRQRLEKAGLFGKDREKLTAEQLKALETLEAIHRTKLNKVDVDLISQNLTEKQKAHETELAQLRYKNFQELSEVNTLADAKQLLEGKISTEQLSKINSLGDARKEIKRVQLIEENALTIKYGEDLMRQLKTAIDTGVLDIDGLKLSDAVLSDEEYEELKDKFLKISEMMSGLKNPQESETKSDKSFTDRLKTADVLGFSQDDWDLFQSNLENGVIGIGEMIMAVQALTSAYTAYSNYLTASENKQLKAFENSSDEKKDKLQTQLNSGRISQEKYTSSVAELDRELDKKKAEISLKQAKREKQIQIMSAISGTASAVVGALGNKPWTPFNFVLASIVGAMGLAQVGAIVAAPMPGLETGGYITRAQDGKQFKAKNQGNKRGYINETSVLVSENGSEFVASAAAVANPEIKQVLDMIDSAQRNGNVSTLNLEKMMYTSSVSRKMNGKEAGGYVSTVAQPTYNDQPQSNVLLDDYIQLMKKLNDKLDKPLSAEVSLLGKNGFIEKQKEYDDIKNNATL